MKKILYVTNYPSPYRVEFFNQLGNTEGIDLTVIFLEHPKDQKHRASSWFDENYDHFQSVFLEKYITVPHLGKIHTELKKWLSKSYDEIVICGYGYPSLVYAILYLRKKKISFSMEIDGGLINNESKRKFKIKNFLISSASKYYSTGSETDNFLKHYGADERRIFHYPFTSLKSSDLCRINELTSINKSRAKKNMGIKSTFTLLSVGQMIHRKGFDILIKSIINLKEDVELYIIGGNATSDLIRLCEENNMKNVHFLDFMPKDELVKYYKAADTFILPTREEIWGLVINEAMSYGLPVITTNRCVAGMELVDEGETGYIVPANNINAMTKAIEKIVEMDTIEMGKHARNKMEEYTIEKMVQTHIELFEIE